MGIWRCKNCYDSKEVGWAEGPKLGTDSSMLPTGSSPQAGHPLEANPGFCFHLFLLMGTHQLIPKESSHKQINISAA